MKSSDKDAWIYERGQQSYKCNWTFELVVAMDLSGCMFYAAYLATFRIAWVLALCEIGQPRPIILIQTF